MNRNEIYANIIGCTLPTIYNYRKEKRLIIDLLDSFEEEILMDFIENKIFPSLNINELSKKAFIYNSEKFKNSFNSFQIKNWSEKSINIFFDFFYINIDTEYFSFEFHSYMFHTYMSENNMNFLDNFRLESYEILSKILIDKDLYEFLIFCIKDNFSSINNLNKSKFYLDLKKLHENYLLQKK